MSGDYKWDIQVIAEELAEDMYGKDFYDLHPDTQMAVYEHAMHKYTERKYHQADYLRKAERERG